MKCAKCGSNSDVTNTRPRSGGRVIKRRRQCISPKCGHWWHTIEVQGRKVCGFFVEEDKSTG